ncbi:MAG: putative Ig domain-containing protein [Magnetococcales bacterium]|nr:putative Ig domain-containing protein [Magnetococcales bacterium]
MTGFGVLFPFAMSGTINLAKRTITDGKWGDYYNYASWDLPFQVSKFSPTIGGTGNLPPYVASAMSDLNWNEKQSLTYTVPAGTFVDPENKALSYSAKLSSGSSLPSWLKFNSSTRVFSGTAPAGSGDYTIRVTAKDTGGLSTYDDVVFYTPAAPTNRPPIVASAMQDQNWIEGQSLTYTVPAGTFSDPDGNTLSYSAKLSGGSSLPSWLKFNSSTRVFSGKAPVGSGDYTIRVTAKDAGGLSTYDDVVFYTVSANRAPVVASAMQDQNWIEGQALTYIVPAGTFSDPEGNTLSYSAKLSSGSSLPSWLKFNNATRLFSGTAPAGSKDYTIRVTATDTGGLSRYDDVVFYTVAASRAPTLAMPS